MEVAQPVRVIEVPPLRARKKIAKENKEDFYERSD